MYSIHRSPLDTPWQPALDVVETSDAYTITVEVPGLRSDEVAVDLNDTTLTIRGDKQRPYAPNSTRMHRIERDYGPFERHIQLPDDIDAAAIEATLEHGVLTLRIAKRRAAAPVRIPVRRHAEDEA